MQISCGKSSVVQLMVFLRCMGLCIEGLRVSLNFAGFDIISIFGSTIWQDIDSLWGTSYGMQSAVIYIVAVVYVVSKTSPQVRG